MNAGSRIDHHRFCLEEDWGVVRDPRGRAVRHHLTYERALYDGTILRTRISHPVNKETYGPRLWTTILRDQLVVTEAEFWACVKGHQLPDRGPAETPAPGGLPAGLAHQLIHVAHVPEDEVRTMTLARALVRMNEHWTRPDAR